MIRIIRKNGDLATIARTFSCGLAIIFMFGASNTMAQRTQPAIKLSSKQQLKKATEDMNGMKAVLNNAFNMLKDARKKQDIQELNCINEALSAIKGLMRLSEQNFVMLQEAVARNDRRTAEHEFVKISIAHNKINDLDGRVRSCGGPSSGGTIDGRPRIELLKDSDLPEEDPAEGLQIIHVNVERPPSASPFF
ncbi:MAG TPA: hypothetical protein EYN06_07495 [Myxococcales bacterium]|nr:hypothetical protein [Myxococcales bacterium]HIN86308.1 hypothetical protein [Myxococcales bacterium]